MSISEEFFKSDSEPIYKKAVGKLVTTFYQIVKDKTVGGYIINLVARHAALYHELKIRDDGYTFKVFKFKEINTLIAFLERRTEEQSNGLIESNESEFDEFVGFAEGFIADNFGIE